MTFRFNCTRIFRLLLIYWLCNNICFGFSIQTSHGQYNNLNLEKNLHGTNKQYFDALSQITLEASLRMKQQLTKLENALINTTVLRPPIRKRRSADMPKQELMDQIVNIKLEFTFEVSSVLVDFAFVQTSTAAYLIGAGLSHQNGSRDQVPSIVWIWNYQNSVFDLFAIVKGDGAVDVEAFSINDEAYFIFALNNKKNYMDFTSKQSKLYKITSSGITSVRSIRTIAATKWKSIIIGQELYLFQASYLRWKHSNGASKRFVPKGSTKVRIFKWFQNSFLEVDSIEGSYTTDLDAVSIMGKTFLAVVNQTVTKKLIESTILIYEIAPKPFMGKKHVNLFQKIKGWYVSDLHFIKFGRELFLAIAYEFRVHNGRKIYRLDSVIFRFNGWFFVQYQSITATCALRWATLYGTNGEIALNLHTATSDQMYLFIDNSWTVQPVSFMTALETSISNRTGLISFVIQDKSRAVIALKKSVNIFELEFQKRSKQDLDKKLLNSCTDLKNRAILLSEAINSAFKDINHVALASEQVILSRKTLLTTKIKELHVNVIKIKNTELFQNVLMEKIQYFQDWIIRQRKMLDTMLLKSKPQIIFNPIKLKKVTIDSMTAKTTHLINVKDTEFCSFIQKVIWLHRPIIEIGQMHFDKITFQDSVRLSGLINNLDIVKDVAHLDKTNVFVGKKIFKDGAVIKGNLNVIGTINSVPFNNFLIMHSDQEIKGSVEFFSDIEVEVMQINEKSSINGIQWYWIDSETIKKTKPIKFHETVEFSSPLIIQNMLNAENINQININKLLNTAVRLDEPTKFLQTMTFTNIACIQNVEVKGRFNGIKLPEELILLKERQWNSTIVFEEQVVFQKLAIDGLVNNVKIAKETVLTKKDHQYITAPKTMNKIVVGKLQIESTLNNINLSRLLKEYKGYKIQAQKYYKHLKVKRVNVTKLPENLYYLLNNGIRTDVSHHFKDHVTFKSLAHFKENVTTPSVIFKDFEPLSSAIPLKLTNKIYSTLIFNNHINIKEQINGIDLATLYSKALLTKGNQEIRSRISFTNDIRIDDHLQVYGRINDVKIADVIKIDENFTIQKLIFHDEVILKDTTYVEQFNVETVKGKLVEAWFHDTFLVDTNQTILAEKIFVHGFNADMHSTSTEKHFMVLNDIYLDDVNIQEITDQAVQSYKTNEIFNLTSFVAEVHIDNLFVEFVDNVNVTQFLETALKRHENRCIRFTDDIVVENLVTPMINDVNITRFLMNVIWRNASIFPHNIHITKASALTVYLEGLVNNIKFSDDVVTLSSKKIVIQAPKYFHNAKISHINMTGLINNHINISYLDSSLLKTEEQTIDGNLNVTNLYLKGNLYINGNIFDFNIADILKTAIFIDENITISGYKEFKFITYNPEFTNNLIVDELIDNTNLTYVIETMVTLDTEQNLTGPIAFLANVYGKHVKVPHIMVAPQSKINGRQLPNWSSIMRTNAARQTINARMVFKDKTTMQNIVVKNKLNDLTLNDLMLTSNIQKITSVLHFERAVIKNIQISNSLMGINITNWFHNAIMRNVATEQHLYAENAFSTIILETNATFKHMLDHVNTSTLMTKQHNQTITGKYYFDQVIVLPSRIVQILHIQNISAADLEMMFQYPIPFSCPKQAILYFGWCYSLIFKNEMLSEYCSSGDYVDELDSHLQEVIRKITGFVQIGQKVILENNTFSAFICKTKAVSYVKHPVVLKGQVYIKNNKLKSNKNEPLLSPLQNLFQETKAKFHGIDHDLNASLSFTLATKSTICVWLRDINKVFQNAYRPTTQYNVIQNLDEDILKIYLLQDTTPKFLALQKQKLSLYDWTWGIFIKIASLDTEWRDTVLNIGLDTFFTKRETVVLIPITKKCPRHMVDRIEVWKLHFPPYQIILNNSSIGIGTTCILPTNINLYIFKGQSILFTASSHLLIMWHWDYIGFKEILSLQEQFPIHFVRSLGNEGHILVVSKNGESHSVFTVYKLDDTSHHLIFQTSFIKSDKIQHVINIPLTTQFVVINEGQLQLFYYFPGIKKAIAKQIIDNFNSVQGLYHIKNDMASNLIVAHCDSTDFYSISGSHLIHDFKSYVTIETQPRAFSYQDNLYLIIKIRKGNKTYFQILRASQTGPLPIICRLPC